MIKCGDGCVPCCDFCIHASHDMWVEDGMNIVGGPNGCKLHADDEHQRIAKCCGECEDFHCFRAERKE